MKLLKLPCWLFAIICIAESIIGTYIGYKKGYKDGYLIGRMANQN